MRVALSLVPLLLSTSLFAQEPVEPRFRVGLGLGGGDFELDFDTPGPSSSDDTDAGLFRLMFEATGRRNIGGGVRLESVVSDDDLFADSGLPVEARNGTLFGHFTYRVESHRFAMPLRAGLILNGLTLEEEGTGDEVEYASLGPMIELAPELTLVRSGRTQWSVFGEIGIGVAATRIDVEDGDEFDSDTGFLGIELGTRLTLGPIELGLSYVGRWQSMDESDPENGFVVNGYDAEFHGVMFAVAAIF